MMRAASPRRAMMRGVIPHPFDARVEVVDTPLGRALVCRPFADLAPHVFTTRDANFRSTDPGAVARTAQLAVVLGVAPDRLARVHQVHSAIVRVVPGDQPVPGGEHPPHADALVTDDRATALAVRVADCVPVLIADRRRPAVAAVHAGWRGTGRSIVAVTVATMREAYGCDPADLVAVIGPSASADRFEVGEDVVEEFRAAGHDEARLSRWFLRGRGPRPFADLWAANRDQLVDAGLDADAITVMGACTMRHRDWFFSHRADGPATGRLVAAIRPRAS
jgi:YfiH family protein